MLRDHFFVLSLRQDKFGTFPLFPSLQDLFSCSFQAMVHHFLNFTAPQKAKVKYRWIHNCQEKSLNWPQTLRPEPFHNVSSLFYASLFSIAWCFYPRERVRCEQQFIQLSSNRADLLWHSKAQWTTERQYQLPGSWDDGGSPCVNFSMSCLTEKTEIMFLWPEAVHSNKGGKCAQDNTSRWRAWLSERALL